MTKKSVCLKSMSEHAGLCKCIEIKKSCYKNKILHANELHD